ncbi:MAG: hypothetical protein ACPHP8_05525, partial [Luminiphilus sp.]
RALARHLGTTETGTGVMAGLASEIPAYAEISRRIQQAELAEERARPGVTENTLTALNQLEEWVRALSVE